MIPQKKAPNPAEAVPEGRGSASMKSRSSSGKMLEELEAIVLK